jgi:hypothetical protein
MALHSDFPTSPNGVLRPEARWFPAVEEMRATAYEKLRGMIAMKVIDIFGNTITLGPVNVS